jgi:hypothetical protein
VFFQSSETGMGLNEVAENDVAENEVVENDRCGATATLVAVSLVTVSPGSGAALTCRVSRTGLLHLPLPVSNPAITDFRPTSSDGAALKAPFRSSNWAPKSSAPEPGCERAEGAKNGIADNENAGVDTSTAP